MRAAGIEHPGVRAGYYVLLLLLGLACRARPGITPFVGMGESAVNLAILMASLFLAIYDVPDQLLANAPLDVGAITDRTIALALSGSVLVYSFYRHQAATRTTRARRV